MDDLLNATVGGYRLEERLGAGGMGVVYRAVHGTIGRVAAVKILTATRDPGFAQRFLNEARIQAELQHPNIATLYEFNELGGRPCIVMEYVDGETLADRIHRVGRLPPDQVAAILRPVAEAVGYIHDNGIVHRDLKSHNIKISSRGAVKLLDFGIAMGSATPRLTLAGQFVGTLHYCSPEQLRGERIDHRSDIWALGVLLYEMLAGVVPFDAPSAGEFVSQVERGEPRPPSEAAPGVPQAFDAVVQRCLAKRPDARYQSARELADAVSAAAGASADAAPRRPARASRASGALRTVVGALQRRPAISLAAAVLAVIAVIIVAALPWGREAPPQPARTGPTAGDAARAGTQPVSIGLLGGRAEVWVDGRRIGTTPARFDAAVGDTMNLELRVPGYRPLRRSIVVLPHSNSYSYSIRDLEPE